MEASKIGADPGGPRADSRGGPPEEDAPAILEASNVSKTFGGQLALDRMGLSVTRGEIHGLLGHNGSGKSTFIKILAGAYEPAPGSMIRLNGVDAPTPVPPGYCRHHGVGFVHQDLGLIDSATVAENLLIGSALRGTVRPIKWRQLEKQSSELLARWNVHCSPKAKLGELAPIDKALVAMVRALHELGSRDHGGATTSQLLVLDELTVFLPRRDVQRLFDVIRHLRNEGVGTLFVSHKSEEVLELTDRVTVLRNGRSTPPAETRELTEAGLEALILGRAAQPPERPSRIDVAPTAVGAPIGRLSKPSDGEPQPAVEVRGLQGGAVAHLDFVVRPGEVLGFAGLEGSGVTDVLPLIFGQKRADGGELLLEGQVLSLQRMDPRIALRAGIVMIPADRTRDGGVGDLTLVENVAPPVAARYSRLGYFRWRRLGADATRWFLHYKVDPPAPQRLFATLSGGNQQKVVLAKWLGPGAKLALLQEPTQGVDVGAVSDILALIRETTRSGMRVLCSSNDINDLIRACDRVIVLRDGGCFTELGGASLTKDNLEQAIG